MATPYERFQQWQAAQPGQPLPPVEGATPYERFQAYMGRSTMASSRAAYLQEPTSEEQAIRPVSEAARGIARGMSFWRPDVAEGYRRFGQGAIDMAVSGTEETFRQAGLVPPRYGPLPAMDLPRHVGGDIRAPLVGQPAPMVGPPEPVAEVPEVPGTMRTDRHRNPTAFTTDVARQGGLVEGRDFVTGDPFPQDPNMRTARLLGDPIEKTIRVIDRIGFYTDDGRPRWDHTAMSTREWHALPPDGKKAVVARMYQQEGGQAMKGMFGPEPPEEAGFRAAPAGPDQAMRRQQTAMGRVGETVGSFAVATPLIAVTMGRAALKELALAGAAPKVPGTAMPVPGADYFPGQVFAGEMWNLIEGIVPPIGAFKHYREVMRDPALSDAEKSAKNEEFLATEGPAIVGAMVGIGGGVARKLNASREAATRQVSSDLAVARARGRAAPERAKGPAPTERPPTGEPAPRPAPPEPAPAAPAAVAEAARAPEVPEHFGYAPGTPEAGRWQGGYAEGLAGQPKSVTAAGKENVPYHQGYAAGWTAKMAADRAAVTPRAPAPKAPSRVVAQEEAPKVVPPQAASIVVGKPDVLKAPSGEYRVRYEVVDADQATASHDAISFQRKPNYPEGLQERAYHRDQSEQMKVVDHAEKFEPRFMLSSVPAAEHGPPILFSDINAAAGGNSRLMTFNRVTKGQAREGALQDYYTEMIAQAERFGLDPEPIRAAIRSGKSPILVRRLLDVASSDRPKAAEAVRRLNEKFTQELDPVSAAVSRAKTMSPETLDQIAASLGDAGEGATLREALRSAKTQSEIIGIMRRENVIPQTEINRYVHTETGSLNDAGIELIEKAIAGSIVPDADLLTIAPRSQVNKVVRAAPSLARARSRGGEWDLGPEIKEALAYNVRVDRLYEQAGRPVGMDPYSHAVEQGGLFPGEPLSARVMFLARALRDPGSKISGAMKSTDFARAAERYSKMSEVDPSQGTLGLGPEAAVLSPSDAFAAAFGPVVESARDVQPLFPTVSEAGRILPEAPRGLYEGMAEVPSAVAGAAKEGERPLLREGLPQAGAPQAEALPSMRRAEGADAPPGLQPAAPGGVAVPEVPPPGARGFQERLTGEPRAEVRETPERRVSPPEVPDRIEVTANPEINISEVISAHRAEYPSVPMWFAEGRFIFRKDAPIEAIRKVETDVVTRERVAEKLAADEPVDEAMRQAGTALAEAREGRPKAVLGKSYSNHVGNRFQRVIVTEGGREYTYDIKVREGFRGTEMLTTKEAKVEALKRHEESKKPPPEGPGPVGGKRIITDEAAAESRQAIKDWFSEQAKGIKPGMGLDPTVLGHMARLGAYYIETGIRDFTAWSARMVSEFGDRIKPYLKEIWEASQKTFEKPRLPGVEPTETRTAGMVRAPEAQRELPHETPADALAALDRFMQEKAAPPPEPLPQKLRRIGRRARALFEAEFTPLRAMEIEVYKAYGLEAPRHGIDRKFELIAGAAAKAEADTIRFRRDVMDPIKPKDMRDWQLYVTASRIINRLQTDPKARQVGNWSVDRAQKAIDGLREKHGQEKLDLFEQQAQVYQVDMDSSLYLQVTGDRLSLDKYRKIKEANEFYAPFSVLAHLEEYDGYQAGAGRRVPTTQDLTAAIKGIKDPDAQIRPILAPSLEQKVRSRVLVEKNIRMNQLAEIAEVDRDGLWMRKIRPDAEPEAGFEKVLYLEKGEPAALEVRHEIARALEGLRPAERDFAASVLRGGAQPLRFGATVFNAGFQAVNLFLADLPRRLLISKYGLGGVPKTAGQWATFPVAVLRDVVMAPAVMLRAVFAAMKGNFDFADPLYMEALDNGVLNSTIARSIQPGAFERVAVPRETMTGRSLVRLKRSTIDSIARFANAIEETNKIANWIDGKRIERLKNAPPERKQAIIEEIVTENRNYGGSPNFLRRPELRQLNLLFMFFNARMQGVAADLSRAFPLELRRGIEGGRGVKPESVAAWARVGIAVGVPTIYLALMNASDEYKEDYDKLPQWQKDNYFNIPRDSFIVNERGQRVREWYTIPKREFVKLTANAVEDGVQFAQSKDPDALQRLATRTFEDISPVNISGSGFVERMESVISSLNPVIKQPFEIGFNRVAYKHAPMVPEPLAGGLPAYQYYETTPQVYRKLGEKFGLSPIMIEETVRGFTGGALNQLTIGKPLPGQPWYKQVPFIQRFMKATPISYEDFYTEFRNAERVHTTFQNLANAGKTDEAVKFRDKYLTELYTYQLLKPISEYLNVQRSAPTIMRNLDPNAQPEQIGPDMWNLIKQHLQTVETMRETGAPP